MVPRTCEPYSSREPRVLEKLDYNGKKLDMVASRMHEMGISITVYVFYSRFVLLGISS